MKASLNSLIEPENFSWWHERQPTNFYAKGDDLSRSLAFYCREKQRLAEYEDRLVRFGADAVTVLNEAAEVSNHPDNLPTLEFDGEHNQQVRYHSSYHLIGSVMYGTGVMQLFSTPTDNVLAMAFLHLLSLNGEAGHACPFACTAGVIKAVSALGTVEQKEKYLPRLIDPDYSTLNHGAQYLTESQGGSDVGANRTIAEKDPDHEGTWVITGEKWFCSNITAHVAVLTARPMGAPEGTRGLGLFLLPQRQPDRTPNGIKIVRLKDKLGTRSLATGEILLQRAKAEALGPLDSGFKNMMKYVINTSRLSNCLFASGSARRAFLTANLYVNGRKAFGRRLKEFPLVRHTVALMKAKSTAILSASLCLARMLDDLEHASSDPSFDIRFFRVLLNTSKYRASLLARESVLAGIECLGGNGTIEGFSIMPRLLRDCIVYEMWEGPHNVLIAQTSRDLRKDSTLDSVFNYLKSVFVAVKAPELQTVTFGALKVLASLRIRIEKQLGADDAEPAWSFRESVDIFGDLFFLSRICAEADWERAAGLQTDKLDSVRVFWGHISWSRGAIGDLGDN